VIRSTFSGEPPNPFAPIEQLYARPFLKRTDVPAYDGVIEPEGNRCASYAAKSAYRLERS
jgi:hypothetical protein